MPTRTLRTVAAALLALAVAGCGGGTAAVVPDGFQVLEHPGGSVAVPADWQLAPDAPVVEDEDPDAVRVQIPDAPAGEQLGATLWRAARRHTSADDAALVVSQPLLTLSGGDETRDEVVGVAGAEDAALVQITAERDDGSVVRGTYVAARRGDGVTLLLRLLGTPEQLDDDLIDRIVASLEVAGA